MIGRVHLPRADEGGPDVEPRVDLRELCAGRTSSENRDARRQLAETRSFLVRPEACFSETLELRHLCDGADGDHDVPGLELARRTLRPHDHLSGANEPGTAADRHDADGLVGLDMTRVVGVVAALAHDHVVAARGCLLPRVVAAAGANLCRVQQRLRWHAAPERARAAEEIALDERDRRAARSRVAGRSLARSARADHDEVEALGHARSA